MKVAVIVVAAGSGTRLGRGVPKALVEVAGRTILEHSLRTVFTLPDRVQVIVVAPEAELDTVRTLAERVAGPLSSEVAVVAGGETRQLSVASGLEAVADGVESVLVHDAARAFTPVSVFTRVVDELSRSAAVIPVLPVVDTVKRVGSVEVTDAAVLGTVDRSVLARVQTPQGFHRPTLVAAYRDAVDDLTDDAGLVAAAGGSVRTVPGHEDAFKITTPWDLRHAELLIEDRAGATAADRTRTGIGIDVHAFDDESPLWLAGLHWPGERGLSGHSDGDPVSHAICDALLSAAGAGDLGSVFGTDDPRFASAHGEVFLAHTLALVAAAGWTVGNVSVQLIAARPKFAPRRAEAEALLSALLGAPVSVSATTSDGLGFTGRTEGIAAVATAVLRR